LPGRAAEHFWGVMVLASHYLKQDSRQNVLIIGSAGGQETKAALVYGAEHVDAVELVGFVVEEGKTDYAKYNGGIFIHPNVNSVKGEGRSFLRSSGKKYDIIQIFSNHTSSSIASGTGAMAANYLQTVEAYVEYFQHLSADGVLQINHHIYPRMLTTAAAAWKQMGRKDFRKHVLVFEKQNVIDNLPTVLIKMTPWNQKEFKTMTAFLGKGNTVVINPLSPEKNFLPDLFFTGMLPHSLLNKINYRIDPPTDNKPFFNFFRKKITPVDVDPANYMNYSTAGLLNSQLTGLFPMDIIHLVITGAASLLFVGIFLFVPLFFSKAGRAKWQHKGKTLVYFACLGAGFIIIELVFIQMFMKLIGYPLYTYSTVVFSLLLSAGIGSLGSEKLGVSLYHRWFWPFIGVISSVVLLLMIYAPLTNALLTAPIAVRIAVAMLMIFPVGFFLGMPFPLGILLIRKRENGAIGWVWGINGLFTVIGGLLSVVLSFMLGFQGTLLVALLAYGAAFILMGYLREYEITR
jgi:predicted membrane-bound spermidine synthase